jgi:hypothetical protein
VNNYEMAFACCEETPDSSMHVRVLFSFKLPATFGKVYSHFGESKRGETRVKGEDLAKR